MKHLAKGFCLSMRSSPSTHGHHHARERGITVAEISAAVAVVSVLSLAATPTFSALHKTYTLRGGALQIFAELQKARMAAVAENNPYRFSVVGGAGAFYTIHDDNNSDGIENNGETVTTLNIQAENPGVAVETTDIVTFAPDGSAPTYGTITVKEGNSTRTVAVSRAGRIRIQ